MYQLRSQGVAAADADDAELFSRYRRTGDVTVRNELVMRYQWLAGRCAASMSQRGVPVADLVQVAEIGLIKAVERFDPDRGVSFSAFATPTMLGEIRRHFRDATWAVSVSRTAKERRGQVQAASDELQHALGRPPSIAELADRCGLDPAAIRDTQRANAVYRCASLEQSRDATGDLVEARTVDASRGTDPLRTADLHVDAVRAIATLPERSRKIILWRFYEELTQREIGERLGVGQVQVSRLLRAALEQIQALVDPGSDDLLRTA